MIERYSEDELIAEQIERQDFRCFLFLSLTVCPKDTISLHKMTHFFAKSSFNYSILDWIKLSSTRLWCDINDQQFVNDMRERTNYFLTVNTNWAIQ